MEYTETTTTTTATRVATVSLNLGYVKSLPGILRICELVLGLLCWAIIASVSASRFSSPHYFVMFVAVVAWLTTLILFNLHLCGWTATICRNLPWAVIELIFNCIWSVLYFIASCVAAAYTYNSQTLSAGAAFAFFTTFAYIIHSFVVYKAWSGYHVWEVRTARVVNT